MRKVVCFIFLCLFLYNSASAQSGLTYKSEAFRNGVFQNETKLNASQVRAAMSENSEALALYNSGRPLFVIGQVVAYPCAFLLGLDLGTRLGGGEGSGTLLAVGATGTAVGLIMALVGEKKIKNSVSLYNSTASSNATTYQVNFGFTPTGIGLSMRF